MKLRKFSMKPLKHILTSWETILVLTVGLVFSRHWFFDSTCTLSSNLAERLKVIPQETVTEVRNEKSEKLAYVQYATNMEYLRLAVFNFVYLRDSDAIGDLVVVFNRDLVEEEEFRWVIDKSEQYGIKLKKVNVITKSRGTWRDSFTKLHIFNLEYDRLIYFDSDSMMVNFDGFENRKQNMNELFDIDWDIDIAMPQAYWLSTQSIQKTVKVTGGKSGELPTIFCDEHKFGNRDSFFATHVIVLKPSKQMFRQLLQYVDNPWWWHLFSRGKLLGTGDYDMEVINRFVDDSLRDEKDTSKFGILDHRVYGVLTGEFKEEDHTRFVVDPQDLPFQPPGSGDIHWDALKVVNALKLVHFSDSPIPKPWKEEDPNAHYNTFKIYCNKDVEESKLEQEFPSYKPRLIDDCDSVQIWNWIRNEFRSTRGYE